MITQSDDTNGFLDLGSLDHAHVVPGGERGNIIRGKSTSRTPESAPDSNGQASESHAPEVIIHRSGDVIESIEFVCTCGQHAVVNLEYDDE